MTRRDLLRLMGVAAGGALAGRPALAAPGQAPAGGRDATLDVAVVGGGVSGVYAAWRLVTAEPASSAVLRRHLAVSGGGRLRVGLFEASDRLGGRRCSLHPEGAGGPSAEMGAMRFPSTHRIVARLVDHLGLATKSFPVAGGGNVFYLRGRRFRARDWSVPGTVPYALRPAEDGRSLDDLLLESIERVVPRARELDPRGWRSVKDARSPGGVCLYDRGFRTALLERTSSEAVALIRDAGGYDSFYGSWNAAEMSSWIMDDFAGTPTYFTLVDGYDALPRRMAQHFTRAGGAVVHGATLRRIRRDDAGGDGALALDFVDARGEPAATVRARQVILALPRRAIERLAPDSLPNTSAVFQRDLASVTPQAAGKVYLSYKEAWWRELGIVAGRSTTDLPIRQCYYFGGDAAAAPQRGALLMASYHDGDHAAFWSTLHPALPPNTPFTTSPSSLLIDEVQRQLRELHGPEARIPEPTWAAYANWTVDTFGGSWHFWNPRTRPSEVIARMQQPVADAAIHVCGEAWSTDQGWVRGALRTAEGVLQQKFALPPPPWSETTESP